MQWKIWVILGKAGNINPAKIPPRERPLRRRMWTRKNLLRGGVRCSRTRKMRRYTTPCDTSKLPRVARALGFCNVKFMKLTCDIEGCELGGKLTRGWCSKHYKRWRSHGNPLTVSHKWLKLGRTKEERFWARVAITANRNECWVWTRSKTADGYGKIRFGGKEMYAHRVAWMLTHGKNPELCILHKCDNPPCANPSHLYEGTRTDNGADKVFRNRQAKGNQFSFTKLNPSLVRMIRTQYAQGVSQAMLAKLTGATQSAISYVISRKSWKHI